VEDTLSWDNLLTVYRKARRGKADRREVQRSALDLEYELFEISRSLRERDYEPGPYRQFWVRDRKRRLISAAPFRDRVVQHAVMNVVEPLLDRHFISDTYASRKGKGVHAAVARYRGWTKRYAYVLKLDIRRYFDSIDHGRLKEKLARHIADPDLRWLIGRIIDRGPRPSATCIWMTSIISSRKRCGSPPTCAMSMI
jgi:retron-type reverse transcriptase